MSGTTYSVLVGVFFVVLVLYMMKRRARLRKED